MIFSPTGVAGKFALWITGQRDVEPADLGGGIIFSTTGCCRKFALWIIEQRDVEPGGMAEDRNRIVRFSVRQVCEGGHG